MSMQVSPAVRTAASTALRLVSALVLAALLPSFSAAADFEQQHLVPSFFVVAHPDDWQLFMGDVAAARIASGNPAVFIYVTAGGADRAERFWRARESGAYASVLAAENLSAPGQDQQRFSCGEVLMLGHAIHRCTFHSSVSYHLRLPDGNTDGSGFPNSRYQSLAKLRAARIDSMESVDGTAKYQSWADLRATLHQIVSVESKHAGHADFEMHTHDGDASRNPGDHSDHMAVAELASEAVMNLPSRLVQYSGYDIARRPANLTSKAAGAKALLFMSYDRQRLLADETWSAYSEFPRSYSAWLFRTYGR